MTITDHYDHNAVLDDAQLGNEPSANFLERVDALDSAVRSCMHVSRQYAGISSPTSQHFYASVLFTTLITRGVSLAILAPHSPWASKLIEHWDYATATGIVRTMLEVRLAFHYLCVDPCSRVEWECRWNILNLHDCASRRKLFEAKGSNHEQVASFESQAEELRDRLRSNAHFGALPKRQQDKFLKGQTPYLFPLEDIGEKAGVDKATFRWLYVLFSSHVHGLPMSFYRMGGDNEDRGRGLPSRIEENYTSLCLSLASSLLVRTRDEVDTLFAGFTKSPDPEADTPAEVQLAKTLETPDALPIGESRTIVKTVTVRIEVTRTAADAVDIVYYHEPTNEIVLRRSHSDHEGSVLRSYDHTFWNVVVNGHAATDRIVADIATERIAFKVDAETRTLSFKMEA